MKSYLFLLFFILCSIMRPVDIFNHRRYKNDIELSTTNVATYVQYMIKTGEATKSATSGFGHGMLLAYIDYYKHNYSWRNLVFQIRYRILCYPFCFISLNWPKMRFLINLLLLIPCLLAIKHLNSLYPTRMWYIIPFFMFVLSFRSFLPGIFLVLYLCKPKTYFIPFLLFSFFSSGMIVLFATISVIVSLSRMKTSLPLLCLLLCLLLPFTCLLLQKGFHFGQKTENRYSLAHLSESLKKSIRKSTPFFFYDLKQESCLSRNKLKATYLAIVTYRLMAFVIIMLVNLFLFLFFYAKKLFLASSIFALMLPFAFLEGYAYPSCFISIFVAFYLVIHNKHKEFCKFLP